MDMLDSYKHRLRKAAAAFCAAAFLLGSVPAARAASVCPPPQVSAACAALIDGRTGQTLYEKDADRRALIASTTKIMTGLLVCEAGETDRRVTVPSLAVGLEGSSMYLKRGETLTRQDLLYGMMLHSGNDAALTLAISVSGSEQAFVRQMNLRAQALGLRQTHFANPHGLDSGENYSSARDLAALTQAALQNQQFRTVVGTKTITCAGRTLTNHNKLLWRYDGCIGVKTGYTRHAGRILVSAAERGESQLIAVTLADPGQNADGSVPEEQWEKIGCAYPNATLSWSNTFRYKKFDLSFSLRASIGGEILNNYAMEYENLSSIGLRNISSNWLSQTNFTSTTYKYSSKYIEDASYLKLDNVTFGYTWDFTSKMIKRLRLSLTAQNVFCITGYSGVDPEVALSGLEPGMESLSYYPRTTEFTFGVNIVF